MFLDSRVTEPRNTDLIASSFQPVPPLAKPTWTVVEHVETMPSSSFASSMKFSFGLWGVNCDIKYILICSFGNIVALSVRQPSAGKCCIYTGSIPAVDRYVPGLEIYKGTRARQGCCFPVAEPWITTMTDTGTFKYSETYTVPQVPDSTWLPWSVSWTPVILVKWTKQKNFTDEGNSSRKKADQRLLTLLGLGEQKFGTYRDYAIGKC